MLEDEPPVVDAVIPKGIPLYYIMDRLERLLVGLISAVCYAE
jgi:hypothetical protein